MQKIITVRWPDGRILSDSQFESAAHALHIALGFPHPDEVEDFYREGGKVMACNLSGKILPKADIYEVCKWLEIQKN